MKTTLVLFLAAAAILPAAFSARGQNAAPAAAPEPSPPADARPGPGGRSPKARAARARSTRYEPEYTARTFNDSGGGELNYGWLAPKQVKTGEKYPLVICLHGSGGSVKASAALARPEMREKYPAFVMVPKAELPFCWAKAEELMRRRGMQDVPEKLPEVVRAIQSLLQTEAIDPARVYITGQSMGGVGSWGAISRHPELFAAAVPVCGAWDPADTPKMVSVPVWAFHGEKDPTVPVTFSRELTAALTKAGGTAKYTEYAGVGHDSWLKAYADAEMWAWLFAQKKKAAATP